MSTNENEMTPSDVENHCRAVAAFNMLLEQQLEASLPIQAANLDMIESLSVEMLDLSRKLRIHAMSLLHSSEAYAARDAHWKMLVDSNQLIKGTIEMRREFGYALEPAVNLAKAYRDRLYAYHRPQ